MRISQLQQIKVIVTLLLWPIVNSPVVNSCNKTLRSCFRQGRSKVAARYHWYARVSFIRHLTLANLRGNPLTHEYKQEVRTGVDFLPSEKSILSRVAQALESKCCYRKLSTSTSRCSWGLTTYIPIIARKLVEDFASNANKILHTRRL